MDKRGKEKTISMCLPFVRPEAAPAQMCAIDLDAHADAVYTVEFEPGESPGFSLSAGLSASAPPVVAALLHDGRAARRGVREGDAVLAVDGTDVVAAARAAAAAAAVAPSPGSAAELARLLLLRKARGPTKRRQLPQHSVTFARRPRRMFAWTARAPADARLGLQFRMAGGRMIVEFVEPSSPLLRSPAPEGPAVAPGDALVRIEQRGSERVLRLERAEGASGKLDQRYCEDTCEEPESDILVHVQISPPLWDLDSCLA